MKFNGIEITEEVMLKTRQYFIDNALACIDDAKTGKVFVNNLTDYIAWENKSIERTKAGGNDHTFTFLQHAYYLMTGESVALLP